MSAPELAPLVTIALDTPIDNFRYDEDGEPFGGRTVAEAIVAQAADQLVRKLFDAVRENVLDEFRDQIAKQVAHEVAVVITNPVQLTNQWGEPTGKTTSVREHIAEEVANQLQSRVNGSYREKSVLQKLIETQVVDALTADLRGVIKEARDKVVGKVHSHAAELLARAVKEGLR